MVFHLSVYITKETKMKKIILLFIMAIMLTFSMNSTANATLFSDTIDNSNQDIDGHFLDVESNKYLYPDYYRYGDQDWGWQHNAIAPANLQPTSTITLNISAFDIDWDSGERDEIFAKNNSNTWVSLGFLGYTGAGDDIWAFTEFTLDYTAFSAVILSGLEVKMDIDSTNQGWAVTLAKSTLCIDGPCDIDPKPPVVPEPSTYLLLGSGIAGLAYWRRRQKAKKA